MLRRSTALTLVALVPSAFLAAAPATAGGETCQGRPATIVGAGPEVGGTSGDDVIVTGTSEIVRAEAGDDLVCVTSAGSMWVEVDSGTGDDVVDASAATGSFTVTQLGTGLDRYVGGRGSETVIADGTDDRVSGADALSLQITDPVTGPRGTYSGSDLIAVESAELDVEVRLDQDRLVVAGESVADITGFRNVSAEAPRVTVRGDDRTNVVSTRGCDVKIFGQGGSDRLDANEGEWPECENRATVRAGAGDDVIFGSLGADRLFGEAGADKVSARAGADLLVGGPGRDRLIGNRGPDVTDGRQGIDRCVAEQNRRCERGRFGDPSRV